MLRRLGSPRDRPSPGTSGKSPDFCADEDPAPSPRETDASTSERAYLQFVRTPLGSSLVLRITDRMRRLSVLCLVGALIVGAAVRVASASSRANGFERFNRYGIAFKYPSGWFVTTRPLSNGFKPDYRFAVSTVAVRRTRADVGPCTPGIARQLPPEAVLAYLREEDPGLGRRRSLRRMPERPRSFRLPTPTDDSLCGFQRGSGVWFPFKDGGRAFYLGIYVGPQAALPTRRALKRLLDGMRIDPR